MTERSRGQGRSVQEADRAAGPRVVAASFAQERAWLASQIARDVPLYHVADELAIHAQIREQDARNALAAVVARHESLRTAFRVVDGELMQVVHPRLDAAMGFADLRGDDPEKQLDRCAAIAADLAFEPFDLGRAPLWRATLARLGDGDWVVLFVAHHAVYDAASGFNVYAELTEMCAAAEQGREPSLPDLAIEYTDYAAWQRDRLSDGGLDGLAGFWDTWLANLPSVHGIPLDRPRGPVRTFAGADVRAALPPEAQQALPQAGHHDQATPFMVLLAAYVGLVHRWSGREDIVVGVPVAGRDRPELLALIGMFVNMLVLRIDTSGNPTFALLVDRVRDAYRLARRHQEMPFQKLAERLVSRRSPGVPPLYQLGFNLLTTRDFRSPSGTAEDDLLLEVAEGTVRLEYNSALFDRSTADSLLLDYVAILAAGLADPATVISRLPAAAVRDHQAAQPAHAQAQPAHAQAGNGAHPSPGGPRTASERLVAAVWSDVLRVERVGVFDDFFGLGGHSLQALRILARLWAGCGVELTIQAFFADPTVAGVAAELERLLAGRKT
jgi:hypothetical protein